MFQLGDYSELNHSHGKETKTRRSMLSVVVKGKDCGCGGRQLQILVPSTDVPCRVYLENNDFGCQKIPSICMSPVSNRLLMGVDELSL